MIAVFLLLGAALAGIALVYWLFRDTLNWVEQALWSVVIGWSLVSVFAYALARVIGSLGSTTVVLVTILIWIMAVAGGLPVVLTRRRESWPGWDRSFTPLLVLLLVFAPIYLQLFVTHMLRTGPNGGIYSGGESTFYDLAYHAAVTTSFVHGANFPPVYTPFPPAPLLYPFLPDFLTALLMAGGMDLHTALVATAVPLCLALTGIFYCFARRLLQVQQADNAASRGWTPAVATFLFFLNGGLGFVYFIQGGRLDINYTHLPNRALVWPNVITDMLLPQRTSMFGLGLGLIVLTCFAMAWTRKDAPASWTGWRHLLAAGVVAGFLPFFHVHSYLAVGFVSGVLFLLQPRRVWLVFWLPALVIALPRLLEFSHLATAGFARFQPGWRGQDQPSWILFCVRNVGLPALLIIPAWVTASRQLRLFYLSFVALLILALLVVISPNDYDNLKLMVYWYAATAVLVADWLARVAQRPFGWALSVPLILVSVFAGVLSVVAEMRSNRLMFSPDDVAAAAFVKDNTAPRSLFLTAPSLHQPILSLAGRKVVRGPTAWLWSHGYPFAEREADVRAIYAGRGDALDLLRYYHPDYIYVGRHEVDELKANQQFFDATFPSTYRQADITIYDSRKLKSGGGSDVSDYPPRELASRIDRDPSEILNEFSSVAYELYRLRKVAVGGMLGITDFTGDLRQLGRGVYIGAPGWTKTLTNNETQLSQQLVARYEGKSDAECVTAFYANAELQPSNSEITGLVQDLVAGRETRATILRRIAHDRHLFSRDYNTAYVLCHYFGYLKRDPDKPPDHDLTGFNFWRLQLDRTRDYRGLTRAFMESDEYKKQ